MVTDRISNRGHLKRLIAAGLIEARCAYRYTDDYVYDNATNFGETDYLPARLHVKGEKWPPDGFITFDDYDFRTCGYLSKKPTEGGVYNFSIHSNLLYYVRFKKEVLAPAPAGDVDFDSVFAGGKVESFTHTKTGDILQVLKLETKLSKNDFKAFSIWLKKNDKGYYSRYAGGFILTNDKKESVA